MRTTDWTQVGDITLENWEEWVAYRQALRDLPANTEDPTHPEWPEPPQVKIVPGKNTRTQLETELTETKSDLETTQAELTETKSALETTRADLTTTKTQLDDELTNIKTQLDEERAKLRDTQTELEVTKLKLTNVEARLKILEVNYSN